MPSVHSWRWTNESTVSHMWESERQLVLARREEQAQVSFNQVAGRFDRSYGPGRSWQAFGHLLLRMLPPVDVADLGSGEGLISELLALRCRALLCLVY